MRQRSPGQTLGNLLLALLNATLILLALCLWLGWGAFSAAERVSSQVQASADAILPMRAEIRELTAEIAAARSAIQDLRGQAGDHSAALAEFEERITKAETRIQRIADRARSLEIQPDILMERAIETMFGEIARIVSAAALRLRGGETEQRSG